MLKNTYFDDLANQFWREMRASDRVGKAAPPALADAFRRVARESLEDGLRMVKACSTGDLKKDPLTQVPVPETADQAHVRKVEAQLIAKVENQFKNALVHAASS